jgi:hypothetical protein
MVVGTSLLLLSYFGRKRTRSRASFLARVGEDSMEGRELEVLRVGRGGEGKEWCVWLCLESD